MQKRILTVLMVVILAAAAGCSKGYESRKNVGDMNISLKADRYPLVMGDNALSVSAADQAGKAITDAKVDVRFYMPPMPGMAPMESMVQAQLKGDAYACTVNVAMEGGWKVDVTVTRPGKPAVTTTFNVDAR